MTATEKSETATAESKDPSFNFISSLTKSLALALLPSIAALMLQNFITQRAELNLVELGSVSGRYEQILVIDNLSLSTLEDIQFSFETPSLTITRTSHDAAATSERVSTREQSIKVSKIFGLRRFWVQFSTSTPLDQSTVRRVGGPIGATFSRTDQLSSPLLSDFIKYAIFLYIPSALAVVYFSVRMRGIWKNAERVEEDLARKFNEARSDFDEKLQNLKAESKEVIADTNRRVVAMRKIYIFRMRRLSDENQFWRAFLGKVMQATLREGINTKKIMGMFFQSNGLLTDKDLAELDEAELSYLLKIENLRDGIQPNKIKV